MGIAPSEARELTLYEYDALLHHWNARQPGTPVDTSPIEHPSDDEIMASWRAIEAAGIARMVH